MTRLLTSSCHGIILQAFTFYLLTQKSPQARKHPQTRRHVSSAGAGPGAAPSGAVDPAERQRQRRIAAETLELFPRGEKSELM